MANLNQKQKQEGIQIPPAIGGFLTNLTRMQSALPVIQDATEAPYWSPDWTDLPSDSGEAWLLQAAGISTQLADRSADIRAFVTAFAQSVANPRPELATLAKWQRISPSALRHRYNDHHVQAVQELLLPEPLIDIVLEPFTSVVDHDFAGVSPALDSQLTLRTRMRKAASDEFYATFGADGSKKLGMSKNPADERVTRPIADIGSFMELALTHRDPDLLPIYAAWTYRFNNRLITPDDVKQTSSRVRRGTK